MLSEKEAAQIFLDTMDYDFDCVSKENREQIKKFLSLYIEKNITNIVKDLVSSGTMPKEMAEEHSIKNNILLCDDKNCGRTFNDYTEEEKKALKERPWRHKKYNDLSELEKEIPGHLNIHHPDNDIEKRVMLFSFEKQDKEIEALDKEMHRLDKRYDKRFDAIMEKYSYKQGPKMFLELYKEMEAVDGSNG